MNQEADNIELRSEEVQEILGTPPGWLARWGTLAALAGVVVLGWIGFWIELPETIETDIQITSIDPPRRFYAPSTIMLKEIMVPNESLIDSGRIILHFSSKAKLSHVQALETALGEVKSDSQILSFQPSKELLLGELQEDYYDFLEKWDQYHLMQTKNYDRYDKTDIQNKIRELEETVADMERKRDRRMERLTEARSRFEKEEQLFKKGILTLAELNPTRTERDNLEAEIQDINAGIRSRQTQMNTMRDRLRSRSGSAKAAEDKTIAFNLLKDSFARLVGKVADWKRDFTIESPIRGTVLYTKDNLAPGQYVQRDSMLVVILPKTPSGMIGHVGLPVEKAGQVNKNQKVQVKLYEFPFTDYGAAWGYVEGKGKIPSGGKIPIEIRFPGDSLVMTKGGRIHPEGELRGKAEIVMAKRRLIQRLFGVAGR